MISLLKGDKEAVEKAKKLDEVNESVLTTAINALELFVGIVAVDGIASKRIEKTREFLNNLIIISLDKNGAERSAYILNTLKKLGQSIGLKDSLIAGIVLENKLTLLTRNIKHFERVSGLPIETW